MGFCLFYCRETVRASADERIIVLEEHHRWLEPSSQCLLIYWTQWPVLCLCPFRIWPRLLLLPLSRVSS